ncbi:hypothetical protein [Cohnella fermenti]|uniref:Uncharacterized protein n=1 Tax=Cohnella fermenti TaxID=2565925 RepID=A0A4S4BQH9_9BACL|nr:hypothetical protein [Cohnella fermenti]THF74852.1 hypothetical protein E6C55_24020 [Cohnella fermenti]
MPSKNIYLMENDEVEYPELMAYTIAKLGSFEWNRTSMYDPKNIFERPAGFYFRFHNQNEIYTELEDCINAFHGKLQWCIHVSADTRHKNYIIEPLKVHDAKLSDEFSESYNLKGILGDNYESFCEQAIEDIPFLCKHIEVWFELENKRPYMPTLP